LIETHFGALGRGLHEKLTSIETRLPPELLHQARYIATMRNNTLHVAGFKLPDRPRLVRYMEAIENHFADLKSGEPLLKPGKDW
jgi:hypothetical protein